MKFFATLERIINAATPEEKKERFWQFYDMYQQGHYAFDNAHIKPLVTPSYASFCTIVAPQNVPKRKNLLSQEGRINLLHAIAHIEYSAIDLALDAAYRFRDKPQEYYDDWLEVAADEVRHFEMLEKLLHQDGARYGDVAVHNALFEASQKTQHSFLERMAVVPRYLEANGLDATPMILQKLKRLPHDARIEEIMKTLEVILAEEIAHVQKGDKWFHIACEEEGKDAKIYFEIIQKYYPRGFLRPDDLNVEARKEAGFSCDELKIMAKKEVCGAL